MPSRLTAWLRRLQALCVTPNARPSWARFWIGAALFLVVKAVVWPSPRPRDPFMHWVDVGAVAAIIALVAIFRLIESAKPPSPPEQHWTTGAGGISVWMPLVVMGLFILGFFVWAWATTAP